MASLQNKAGKFVKPTDESGAATLAHVEFPENLRIWPEDPAGDRRLSDRDLHMASSL